MSDTTDQRGSLGYVFLLTAAAALGGLLFGYDTAVIAGAIKFLKVKFELNDVWEGFAVANVLIGCMFGAALAGAMSDRLGRKRSLILSALLFLVSALGAALPQDIYQFIGARLIGGFGVGMASMLSPLYIAEVAPPHIRGRLVSANQVAIIGGMLIVSLVNWLIASPENSQWNIDIGWRWMFASGAIPAVLFLAAMLFAPESPRWLVKQGRSAEAQAILTRVGGAVTAARQMGEIEDTIAHEGGRFRELFRPGVRAALMIAVALAILQQVTGINAVLYYAPKIFEAQGVSDNQALLQTVALQVMNLACTLLAIWVVDRLGRKPLLLITSLAMGVSLLLLGWAFHAEMAPNWIFAFTLAYVGSFAIAMGPVVWVVLSEIFPTRIRGRAMSVATFVLWVACFAISQSVPWMFANCGRAATVWSYAVMCVAAVVFVALYVPETKGKTLEEIERTWLK